MQLAHPCLNSDKKIIKSMSDDEKKTFHFGSVGFVSHGLSRCVMEAMAKVVSVKFKPMLLYYLKSPLAQQ